MRRYQLSYPSNLKYSQDHEWALISGNRAVVGITYFAQSQLGDVVFLELPEVGARLVQNQQFGVIESVKTASDLLSPVSGTVAKVNSSLSEHPELVNQDPYGKGWMLEIQLTSDSEVATLLNSEQYEQSLPKD
jgi:glycine cleavage system H protein